MPQLLTRRCLAAGRPALARRRPAAGCQTACPPPPCSWPPSRSPNARPPLPCCWPPSRLPAIALLLAAKRSSPPPCCWLPSRSPAVALLLAAQPLAVVLLLAAQPLARPPPPCCWPPSRSIASATFHLSAPRCYAPSRSRCSTQLISYRFDARPSRRAAGLIGREKHGRSVEPGNSTDSVEPSNSASRWNMLFWGMSEFRFRFSTKHKNEL